MRALQYSVPHAGHIRRNSSVLALVLHFQLREGDRGSLTRNPLTCGFCVGAGSKVKLRKDQTKRLEQTHESALIPLEPEQTCGIEGQRRTARQASYACVQTGQSAPKLGQTQGANKKRAALEQRVDRNPDLNRLNSRCPAVLQWVVFRSAT